MMTEVAGAKMNFNAVSGPVPVAGAPSAAMPRETLSEEAFHHVWARMMAQEVTVAPTSPPQLPAVAAAAPSDIDSASTVTGSAVDAAGSDHTTTFRRPLPDDPMPDESAGLPDIPQPHLGNMAPPPTMPIYPPPAPHPESGPVIADAVQSKAFPANRNTAQILGVATQPEIRPQPDDQSGDTSRLPDQPTSSLATKTDKLRLQASRPRGPAFLILPDPTVAQIAPAPLGAKVVEPATGVLHPQVILPDASAPAPVVGPVRRPADRLARAEQPLSAAPALSESARPSPPPVDTSTQAAIAWLPLATDGTRLPISTPDRLPLSDALLSSEAPKMQAAVDHMAVDPAAPLAESEVRIGLPTGKEAVSPQAAFVDLESSIRTGRHPALPATSIIRSPENARIDRDIPNNSALTAPTGTGIRATPQPVPRPDFWPSPLSPRPEFTQPVKPQGSGRVIAEPTALVHVHPQAAPRASVTPDPSVAPKAEILHPRDAFAQQPRPTSGTLPIGDSMPPPKTDPNLSSVQLAVAASAHIQPDAALPVTWDGLAPVSQKQAIAPQPKMAPGPQAPIAAVPADMPPPFIPLDVTAVAGPAGSERGLGPDGIPPEPGPARAASAPSPLPSPPAPPLARQIVESLTQQPEGRIEVRLDPEELGAVKVTMVPDGDRMRVVIMVERPETMDLLRRNQTDLAQEFRAIGYETTSFSFGRSGRDSHQRGIAAPIKPDLAEGVAPPSPPPASGGLDLRL